jgi:hypothetical protein
MAQIWDRPRHKCNRAEPNTKDRNVAASPRQKGNAYPHATGLLFGRIEDRKYAEWHRFITRTDYRRLSSERTRPNNLTRVLCITRPRHFLKVDTCAQICALQ